MQFLLKPCSSSGFMKLIFIYFFKVELQILQNIVNSSSSNESNCIVNPRWFDKKIFFALYSNFWNAFWYGKCTLIHWFTWQCSYGSVNTVWLCFRYGRYATDLPKMYISTKDAYIGTEGSTIWIQQYWRDKVQSACSYVLTFIYLGNCITIKLNKH